MVHSLIWWFPKPAEDNHIFDTFWVESKKLSARRYGLFIVHCGVKSSKISNQMGWPLPCPLTDLTASRVNCVERFNGLFQLGWDLSPVNRLQSAIHFFAQRLSLLFRTLSQTLSGPGIMLIFMAPSRAQGVAISVSPSVTLITIVFVFLAEIFKQLSQLSFKLHQIDGA